MLKLKSFSPMVTTPRPCVIRTSGKCGARQTIHTCVRSRRNRPNRSMRIYCFIRSLNQYYAINGLFFKLHLQLRENETETNGVQSADLTNLSDNLKTMNIVQGFYMIFISFFASFFGFLLQFWTQKYFKPTKSDTTSSFSTKNSILGLTNYIL